jgi:hypothetical protein
MALTKKEVEAHFPGLLSAWRRLPENTGTDEQQLNFGDFYRWLQDNYPDATKFRSTMGPREDLEMWFDHATHQSWRN